MATTPKRSEGAASDPKKKSVTEKVKKAPAVKAAPKVAKAPKATATATAKRSEAAAPAPAPIAEPKVEPKTAPKAAIKTPSKSSPASEDVVLSGDFFYAAGNRKTSVARVRLYEKGAGKFTINNQTLEEYIRVPSKRDSVKAPLRITGHLKTFDISIHSEGGGQSGQADAMRHGISKALLEFDPSLRITLKRAGFLTRDPRMKERKKYGLHRARRAPQWSKR